MGDAPAIERLRERFLQAQLSGDRRAALRLITDEGLDAGLPATTLQLDVIQQAQREIGRLWQENTVTIAQEHLATAIANLALAQLYDRAPHAPRNGRKVVVACVEGEWHDLPARLVADALDMAGFDVHFLGANVPTDSLIALVAAQRPDLVALSVTMAFNAAALRATAERLRAEVQPPVPIAVGGGACDWVEGLARDVGADLTACDAAELTAVATALFEARP